MDTDLYVIQSVSGSDGEFECLVELNPGSVIYKAHFPEEPITPGVCLLQMVSDCVERALGRNACLRTARNVKFIAVVSPKETSSLSVSLRIQDEAVKATVQDGDKVFAKMSLVYAYV
ncbi:MAG TPA: hypothetical protein IAC03_06255 [Candidatus Coprenecus pullistercoris]|nr:hypothetical protein [Candidatus Coprenecus pullistercoris]